LPTYEYECQRCGHRFERFQLISDKPVRTCPECRGKVKRLIGTGAGIIFKGEGFYVTDYRSKDYQEKAKADTPSPAASEKATETKTETKAESGPVKAPSEGTRSRKDKKPSKGARRG
jgi:putative FmdB family regulatory protein